ncbi:MAG: FtsQ-type POTRA domain-containing protein [Acidobacteria bacterium]|nr:FtsQ-type POTRA domain-containing protein [Acidobacteriota bacterium]
MPRNDAQIKVELPTRVDVASAGDHELVSEFDGPSSLAEPNSEPQFRRADRRVSVRKGALPKKTAGRIRLALLVLAVLSAGALAYGSVYRYGARNWRFRIESSDDINISGLQKVSRSQVMEVLGGDIGRNVFFVPLEQRKKQLEQIPWVQSATVMRLLPNHLAVEIQERTPVAFARVHNAVQLVDAHGVLMDMPRRTHFSFPVILGISDSDPLSSRSAQMKIYGRLIGELDAGGTRYSTDLSEVDLSDPDDIKVTVTDPDGAVLVHLGNEQFLERFKIYLSHVAGWRQQFQRLESVDLRFDGQIIVNPDETLADKSPRAKHR